MIFIVAKCGKLLPMLTRTAKSNRGRQVAFLALLACLCGSAWSERDCVPDETYGPDDSTISVTLPDQLLLAQSAPITLTVTKGNIKSISLYQKNESGGVGNTRSGVDINGTPKILSDEGQTKTLEFVPVQIGDGAIDVWVWFTDGKERVKSCKINVGASAKGLKKFILDSNSHFKVMGIYLGDPDKESAQPIQPEVYYDQLDDPIRLADASQITFTIEQPEDNPVIRVDSDGLVHGIRPGTATITGDFDGAQDTVKVTVYAKGTGPASIMGARAR